MIVVDADLPKRLATQLRERGRQAVSAAELGLDSHKDPDLLRDLADKYASQPWILITGDDTMPAEHGEVLLDTGATVATIHPEHPAELTQDAWRRDVVHRWAHSFQTQTVANIRRYSGSGSQLWTPRRRHLRAAADRGWKPWSHERVVSVPDAQAAPEPTESPPERFPGFD